MGPDWLVQEVRANSFNLHFHIVRLILSPSVRTLDFVVVEEQAFPRV